MPRAKAAASDKEKKETKDKKPATPRKKKSKAEPGSDFNSIMLEGSACDSRAASSR